MAYLRQQQNSSGDMAASGPEMELKFLQYAQSNRCTQLSDSSVSYAAAALTMH